MRLNVLDDGAATHAVERDVVAFFGGGEPGTAVLDPDVPQGTTVVGVIAATVQRGGIRLILLLNAAGHRSRPVGRISTRRRGVRIDGSIPVDDQTAPATGPAGIDRLVSGTQERRQLAAEHDGLERGAVGHDLAVTLDDERALARSNA